MENREKHDVFRTTLVGILLGIIVVAFFLMNIRWFSTVYKQWHRYEINSGAVRDTDGVETRYYGDTSKKYCVTISKPRYLRFDGGGFLSVSFSEPYSIKNANTENPTANRDVNIVLFFWPKIDEEFECGVILNDDINGIMYQVYLDEKLGKVPYSDAVDEDTEKIDKCMEENAETIKEMYEFGIKEFGLDKEKHIVGEYQ